MTQPERILTRRADVADELKCLMDEGHQAYLKAIEATASLARVLHRLDEITIAVLRRPPDNWRPENSAAPTAPAQAATPAAIPLGAQDEGQPVQVGKASDEVPERGVGKGKSAGQSEEIRHAAGAGGESAASADTAPAADGRRETMEEPRVPRRAPEVRNAGGGFVQDGGSAKPPKPYITVKERAVDDYAATGDRYVDIARRIGSTENSVGVAIASARTANDSRAKVGDEKRAARLSGRKTAPVAAPKQTPPAEAPARTQTDDILDLWATTDLTKEAIAQKLGLNPGAPSARLSAARSLGDKRVAEGDLRRAGQHAQNFLPIGEGHLIRIEMGSNTGRVFGPGGRWDTTITCAKALSVLADGNLYGVDRMDAAAGLKRPHTSAELVPQWQAGLKKIGIDLVHTKGIGCCLRLIAAEVA